MSITITEVRNAVSRNDDNTEFDLEINHPEYGWIPYLLTDYDDDETINNDDLRSLIGNDYSAYVAPTQEELDEKSMKRFRFIRDQLLKNLVDPIVSNPMRWGDLSENEQSEVRSYRQSLLDISLQATWPREVYWPVKPDCVPDSEFQINVLLED